MKNVRYFEDVYWPKYTVKEAEKIKKKLLSNKTNYLFGNEGNLLEKDKACGSLLTKDSCGSVDCCVWAKKNKTKNFRCVGGDAGGATYDGHSYDEYYYKNKMFGNQKIKESDNTSN